MSGMIWREGFQRKGFTRRAYVRSDGTKVPATKIPAAYIPSVKITDRIGSNKIPMKDERHLHDFGYRFIESATDRHKSLLKAVKSEGKAYVVHRLNALQILHKTTNPIYSKKASEDIDFVHKH
jgi:hypothetical protein